LHAEAVDSQTDLLLKTALCLLSPFKNKVKKHHFNVAFFKLRIYKEALTERC